MKLKQNNLQWKKKILKEKVEKIKIKYDALGSHINQWIDCAIFILIQCFGKDIYNETYFHEPRIVPGLPSRRVRDLRGYCG